MTLKCVSLFSGCGGLDLGLHRAGFRVVLANDNDPYCGESYRMNFPGTLFHLGPVSDLDSRERVIELSKGSCRGTIDLLAGGPPCPPFSKSRFYLKDKPRALADTVAADTLGGYLAVLELLRPRAFLLENVFGLAYHVHRDALKFVLDRAKDLGYSCSYQVLNAADFGVPQIRERLFLIGVLAGAFLFPEPTHVSSAKADLFSGARLPWVTAGQAISDLDTDENADDRGHFAGGRYHNLLDQIPPGDNYLYFTEKRGHPNPVFGWRTRYWSFLLKLSPNLPSWTIQARRSNNMGPFHWRNRILRIEEIKRLQTFPGDWLLAGSVERQWRQIGNAVPPFLAERIGHALVAHLSKERGSRARRR